MGWLDAQAVLEWYSEYQTNEELRMRCQPSYANSIWPPSCRLGGLSRIFEAADETLLPVYARPTQGSVTFAPGGVRLYSDSADDSEQRSNTDQSSEDTPDARLSRGPTDTTSGARIRRFTGDGLRRASDFLAFMRDNPRANREPPQELLFGDRYSRRILENVNVDRRPFKTRREVGEYLSPKFRSIRPLVSDHAGLWSWLGIYFFADTVQVADGVLKLSPVDETFVFADSNDRHAYRHYLRGSWRLYEAHGESVAYLLDQDLTSFGDIAERVFGSVRIFNSAGVIQLILRLYTRGSQQKRGFGRRPGGLRHLIRVLDQLERTYDVYGMSPDALIRILPEEFRRWDSESVPRAIETAAKPEPAAVASKSPPTVDPLAKPGRGKPTEQQTGARPLEETIDNGDAAKPTPSSESETPSVRQTLLEIRVQIEQQGQVSWTDPREHLKQGSEAWAAYVATCGVPERRLFRTAFLHRLDEVLASLE